MTTSADAQRAQALEMEILDRLNKITPGPWESVLRPCPGAVDGHEIRTKAQFQHTEKFRGPLYVAAAYSAGNAEFVAHAPEDVGYLLEATAALREENARLREELQSCKGVNPLSGNPVDWGHAAMIQGLVAQRDTKEVQLTAVIAERDTLREALEGLLNQITAWRKVSIGSLNTHYSGHVSVEYLASVRAALKEPR